MNIQQWILDGKLELAWSFILEYENDQNPFIERRWQIEKWQNIAVVDCSLSDEIYNKSKQLMLLGLRAKDSYHIACAISAHCNYFITSDAKILNKHIHDINVINPVDFLYLMEGTI
jgi:predicted nucleic acid-binding protein